MSSLEVQAGFYDEKWRNASATPNGHALRRWSRIVWMMGLVSERESGRDLQILELGCGTGWIANELAKFGDVHAIDLSGAGIDIARHRWPAVEFEVGDVAAYRAGRQFDLVVSSEVVEHIENQAAFFETIDASLKPGGYAIVTCPNGRMRHLYNDSRQPIEQWPTPRRLRGMAASFEILRHEVFFMEFGHSGPLRLFNSPKLRMLFSGTLFEPLYEVILATFGFGLYQILLLRKQHKTSAG